MNVFILFVTFRYKEQIQKISKLIADRPMTGLDKAIWWIEYVIRNKGAPYFKYEAREISWYKFLMLDVVTFLLAVTTLLSYIFYKTGIWITSLVQQHFKLEKNKVI